EAKYELAGNVGSRIFLLTDLNADRGKVIAVDLEDPARENWERVVPEGDDTLQTAVIVGDRILALYMHHASHRVRVFDLEGSPTGEVGLPGLGSVAELSGRQRDEEAFLNFQSQLHPPTILRYALNSASVEPFFHTEVDFDEAAFDVTQLFATADDGVQIPMFVTHQRDVSLDGTNPTMLYAYGGFDISLTPLFAPSRIAFLERGGVIVDANLRGGGEYGDKWHRAGMLENKQRVFDDFYAVAELLIDEKWTSAERLAIFGGSNGGLLVAVSLLQRPELFGAAVAAVPVADMLRYHQFTAGRYWIPEYGNAEEDPDHFEFLYAYSPVHNVKPDPRRPPILITTAETDDRVVPMHAWKFAAALQEVSEPDQLVLLRTERRAGHGIGKPVSKVIDEAADIYAFLVDILEME
ncbi:MAG: prolyl oligopeptidase family protein, partial [Acidimicrobiia bacterium]